MFLPFHDVYCMCCAAVRHRWLNLPTEHKVTGRRKNKHMKSLFCHRVLHDGILDRLVLKKTIVFFDAALKEMALFSFLVSLLCLIVKHCAVSCLQVYGDGGM